jgi:hypothetical protein
MRLSFLTVGILAYLIAAVAAWSKEGKSSPDASVLGPNPPNVALTNGKPQTKKFFASKMKLKLLKALVSHSTNL